MPRQITPEARSRWRAKRSEIAAASFSPRSHLSLSQWADKKRFLSADLGEPGQWRTDRVPYMRRIMDAVTDRRVTEVSVMKPTRIGATQAIGLNTIGYYVDQEPSPIIVALPTLSDATKFSTQLMQPMFDDTPCLQGKLEAAKSKKRRSTFLEKSFPGGALQIIGTTSPRAMRMVHGRVIIMSEIDAWEFSAGTEGAPDKILPKRAGAYGNPKFIRESSPLYESTSRIKQAVESGSMERFHVPCPHCGEFQELVWGGRDVAFGLKWDSQDPASAYYVCRHNGCVIEETLKERMTVAGVWVAEHPERKDHLSFYLNALISSFPGARWPILVAEWLGTKGKPEKLRVFVNTVLGETFKEEGAKVESKTVADRYEPYRAQVPMGVGKLVRTVDVQGDRLETLVVGYGEGEELWPIEHEIIEGDPGMPEGAKVQPGQLHSPWDELTRQRARTYRHESGELLTPAITGIDLGGHHAKNVHAYARKHRADRVYGIRGSNLGEGVPLISKQKYSNTGAAFYYTLGVFGAKEAIMKRLEKLDEAGPGYIHIPDWMDQELINQLTAEELITSLKGGRPKREWIKRRDRNEFLDLTVYSLCILHALGPAVVRNLGGASRELAAKAEAKKKASGGENAETTGPSDDTPTDQADETPTEPRRRRGWMTRY